MVRIDAEFDRIFKLKWREDGYPKQEVLMRKLVQDYVSGDRDGTRYPEVAALKPEQQKVVLALATYAKLRPSAIAVVQAFLNHVQLKR